ncbi:protein SPA1-RELATED 3 isoform X2 [Ananas comosus]|uniref:Protein SPA1-RELATED 3 isoform X2 n=1 Tax=Ananas comosus TaxID=4615 RepID=A0A6P5G097_ANACO|nr:protein SPA1-RELATED 3 isoform X2 [Ananas comosus]
MEGSEETSGWGRLSTSRGPPSAAAAAASSGGAEGFLTQLAPSLGGGSAAAAAAGAAAAAAEEEEEEEEEDVEGHCEISLREWLDRPGRSVDLLESLHVFRQVVEAVSLAHAQGVVVGNVRPSCFVLSPLNRVSFIESASCSTSGSDSCEEAPAGPSPSPSPSPSPTETASEKAEEADEAAAVSKAFPLKQILLMEFNWYTSPEEASGGPSTFASDIYRLGVLLFELFCTFGSLEGKLTTMANLRHRVLPPQLLLNWPKEASFCLWLLHPEPDPRPKMSEVLQSEFLNQPRDSLEVREAAIRLKEEMEDQELLLEFLLELQRRKQEVADKLRDTVSFLSTDINEVLNQRSILREKEGFCTELDKDELSAVDRCDQSLNEDPFCCGSRKRFRPQLLPFDIEEPSKNLGEGPSSGTHTRIEENILSKSSRLMKNFKKLEVAYFLSRSRFMGQVKNPINSCCTVTNTGRGSVTGTEGSSVGDLTSKEGPYGRRQNEWINPFFEGLCKYLSFSKFEVRADLKQGDLLSSSNLVCSLGFDRDKDFFATAGVNKKIKVFDCNMILNEDRDIHYPVVEMSNRSKLSCICWNNYMKSQIASSDFEGAVQVWDVTRSQVFVEMREHERRVWSVDFSLADPTKLASGSDDGSVKLWNINKAGSIGTIRTKANVCSVQFQPDSARFLAIGSADHKIYCYDLRNLRIPFCTLIGHTKTVSNVKYLDSSTIVSASTDNSLMLWDLSTSQSRIIDSPLQTFTGHTNIKNFVGLSISDGYIATGSETNEVFVYHRAFPMPVLSYKFNVTDPLSGEEVDDPSQFVSCVCWRGQSSTLVGANSSGNIKLLEMV